MPDFDLVQLATALLFGTCLGFVLGVVPGFGGRVGIILCMPVAVLWDPPAAAVFLFSMHAVIHTATSIPAIAFGIPATAADAATVIDGYPLARMGRAGEALGASLSASAFGGVIGAIVFMLSIPIARPLITSFGPPEFLILALFGIALISTLAKEGVLQGVAVALLGVTASLIGYDVTANQPRLTYGILELWDGLDLAPLVVGLFIVPEMLTQRLHDADAHKRAVATTLGDVMKGMAISFHHMPVLIRSTFHGIWIGAMPALGSSVAVWMSYAYAARTTKSEIPFGQGAIAGVIAPEAANNSKEGGSMIPTLLFGIPGSSSMALMMAALAFAGVAVGPAMLTTHLHLSYMLGGAVILSNLIAIPVFFAAVPGLVRLSALRREMLVPIAIAVAVTSTLLREPSYFTFVQLFLASALGLGLKAANWPRAPFILGFVVADLAETSAYQTWAIWGLRALERPFTLVLGALLLGWIAYALRYRPLSAAGGSRPWSLVIAIALGGIFATIAFSALQLRGVGSILPAVCGISGFMICGAIFIMTWRSPASERTGEPIRHAGWLALYLVAIPFAGLTLSTFAFTGIILHRVGLSIRRSIMVALVLALAQLAIASLFVDVLIEREILGRALWAMFGF